VRRPLAPEHDLVVDWVTRQFTPGWASEARVALGNRPPSLFIAVDSGAILGFCAYDATARGFVGPVGVADAARGRGVGAALLRACLADMRSQGYAYAVAGAVGAPDFFRRVAGAIEIPNSSPGVYGGMLKP
jgi:ribosomal protein S18 acetylase RimI-like enzyme